MDEIEQSASKIEQTMKQHEDFLDKLEAIIFGDAPFSARKIKEGLIRVAFLSQTGYRGGRGGLEGKKAYYEETMDEAKVRLDFAKEYIMIWRDVFAIDASASPQVERVVEYALSLLERIEKCEEEISKIRGIIREY